MKFSVIIPTCHRNEDLAKCLDCLAPGVQLLDHAFYEVIVSDDGQETTAEEMIREHYPWAKWTQGPRRGPAANRNHGAQLARSDWLVFTDDDCLPTPTWLQAYGNALAQGEVLEGLTRADREQRSFAEEAPVNMTGGFLWSCNFAIRKSVFNKIGRFDENFPAPAMEDCDLRENLREAGYDFPFVPAAEVVHPWRPCRGLNTWEMQLRACLHFYAKHPHLIPKKPALFQFLQILRVIKNTILGNLRNFGVKGLSHMLRRLVWDFRLVFRINKLMRTIDNFQSRVTTIPSPKKISPRKI